MNPRTLSRILRAATGGLLLAALVACGSSQTEKPWGLKNITGDMPDLQFTLTDDTGHAVTQKDYAGKAVLLYFGYTHCPDVCPATLADLARAVRMLGADAERVRILFVSVDPARDTPAVLGKYAAYFGPQVVGLTGTSAQLEAVTKRYRVAYRLGTPDAKGDYTVYHSSAVFIFDPQGKARLLTSYSDQAEVVAADLKRLLAEPSSG